jgi:regulator of replication initiation timing
MPKIAAPAPSIDLEPIDRLEEKLKQLVGVVERMKAEQSRAVDDNRRLLREVESLRSRLSAGDSAAAEVAALRQERDVIRARVSEMLEQLEALSL